MASHSSSSYPSASELDSKVIDQAVLYDPRLSSWMTRDTVSTASEASTDHISSEEESKKKDKDSEIEIRELFRLFDKNHDNTIDSCELGKMLRCMGMELDDEDVLNIMDDLDKNGNGKIEYREFKAFMQDEMKRSDETVQDQERAIRTAFQVFDKTGEGLIDFNELKAVLKKFGEPLSESEFSDMTKRISIEEDGMVNYDDFIKVWMGSSKTA